MSVLGPSTQTGYQVSCQERILLQYVDLLNGTMLCQLFVALRRAVRQSVRDMSCCIWR